MSIRISSKEFKRFKSWLLNTVGVKPDPVCGEYEVLRWPHMLKNKPKPIAFRNDKNKDITLNLEAAKFYKEYRQRLNSK